MEETKTREIIDYTEGTELEIGKTYLKDRVIFTYQPCEEKPEKPYLLDNGYRLDHLPTTKDIGTSNLTSMSSRSEEEKKKIGSMGGNKSVEVQYNRRTFKQSMEMILSIKAPKEAIEELPAEVQDYIKNSNIIPNIEDLINIKAALLAADGSVQHAIFSRDTVGEKPTDKQEIQAEVITDADRNLLDNISRRLSEHKE